MARRKIANDARKDFQGLEAQLFSEQNRGLLLDIFVFLANVLVMRLLSQWVIGLFQRVSVEDPTAKLLLGLMFLAMWILPAGRRRP